jgi:hypothetical protein
MIPQNHPLDSLKTHFFISYAVAFLVFGLAQLRRLGRLTGYFRGVAA